jgi:large subunit ribosomal protein L33
VGGSKSWLSGHSIQDKSLFLRPDFHQRHGIMAKKGNRVQVILECTEHKESGQPGTSRYITTKNRKNTPDRIEIKKYNPILRKMTVHKEIK